jgi:hypothetical protein
MPAPDVTVRNAHDNAINEAAGRKPGGFVCGNSKDRALNRVIVICWRLSEKFPRSGFTKPSFDRHSDAA